MQRQGEGRKPLIIVDLGIRYVRSQRHDPVALYHREKGPGIRWIGGSVGLGVRLDTETRGIIFASGGDGALIFILLFLST
jgi:hypothetical protein